MQNQELTKLRAKKEELKARIQKGYRTLCQQDNVGLFNEPPDAGSSAERDIDSQPVLKTRKNIMKLEMEHDRIICLIQKLESEVGHTKEVTTEIRPTTCHCPSTLSTSRGRDHSELSDFSDRSDLSKCSHSSRGSKHRRHSKHSKDSKGSKSSKSSKHSKGSENSIECSSWELCHPPKRVEIIGVIVRVFPRSPGRKAGLRPGDFIVQFGDIDAQNYNGNPNSIVEYAESHENERIRVKIFRGGKMGVKKLVPKPWRGCGLLGFRFGNVFK